MSYKLKVFNIKYYSWQSRIRIKKQRKEILRLTIKIIFSETTFPEEIDTHIFYANYTCYRNILY